MHTELLVGIWPLVGLFSAFVLLFVFLAMPLRKVYPDDQGDGNALVLIPPPKLPSLLRAPALVLVFTSLYVVYHSITGPLNPDALYKSAVTRLVGAVVNAPAEVNGYLSHFSMGLRFLVVGTMISLAVVGRGTAARRILIAAQAVWYLAVMICFDALLTVVEILFGIPVGPSTLLGGFAALALSFVALTRMMFVSFALPRPSAVPFVPRPRASDALTLLGLTGAAVALCTAGVIVLYHLANPKLRDLLPIVAPVPFAVGTVALRTVFLAILGKVTVPPEPEVGDDRPLIEVIVPAYNEEDVIVDCLRALDAAAGRYGGPVRVILTNDGSTDRTQELAEATMDAFQFARGKVIQGTHGGKSAALNLALEHTTADIVIRIDADSLVDEWALFYTPRWFRDPKIGLVEALMWPRWHHSVFPHMRLFEELRQFAMNHRTLQLVDAVNVVPGVFTAFRRSVAMELGGFTVGMNGEDGDFTLRFSRLGYRSQLDPRVVAYEDVPPTYMEIREQRVRWDRSTIHNNARHGPWRAGLATPKVWFSHTHQFFTRVFAPIRVMLPFYLLLTALFEGTYRNVILLLFGAWVMFLVAYMVLEGVLALVYHKERHLAWVLLFPFWMVCSTIFSTESWLSLPGRPAGLRGSSAAVVEKAVVH